MLYNKDYVNVTNKVTKKEGENQFNFNNNDFRKALSTLHWCP